MPATAEKAAEKTTDKSLKPSKNTSKVFDVSKPNKQPASATSRPVIIPNRPIMQDPMMAPDKDANSEMLPEKEAETSPSTASVTIQPISAAIDAPKPEDTPAEEVKNPEEPGDEAVVEPVSEPTTPEELPVSNDSTLDEAASETKDEKLTAELEASAKRQAELDTLVASQEYFLPINAVERHRSKITTLLGLVLIVGLGLLLVNLMLDAGFLDIPGVSPLTHFFST